MWRPPPATGRIGPSSSARRILANVPVKSKLFALLRLNRETYVFYEHLCRGTQASTWVISHRRTTMCCSPHSFFVLSCCQLRLIRTPHLAPECRGTWMVKCHNSPNCDRATWESNPGSSAWQADVIATRPWCPLYIYEIYFCNLQDRIHSTNYTIALSYFIANFFIWAVLCSMDYEPWSCEHVL